MIGYNTDSNTQKMSSNIEFSLETKPLSEFEQWLAEEESRLIWLGISIHLASR